MHQTLYRKYRPSNFDDVYGQEIIVKILRKQVETDNIAHAYIFSGPRGTGKTSVAKIFAKVVNCISTDNKPCNECVNCTQINNGDSLDIVEIDAASNNGIDEIRELKSKVSLVPTSGKYKVYIIDEVHMLTVAAFNALLKTLEEPPSHIIFILATTEIHKIPETILSRCQKFEFKRISDNEIVRRLEQISKNENIDIKVDALKEIARLSEGGMRDSIGNLELASAYQSGEITISDIHEINGTISQNEISLIVDGIIRSDIRFLLESFDEYYNNGKNIVKIIEEIILYLKNCLVTANISDYFENNLVYIETNNKLEYKKNVEIINFLSKNLVEIKKYSNAKIMIEIMFINLINNFFGNIDRPEERKIVSELNNLKQPTVSILMEAEQEEVKVPDKVSIKEEVVEKVEEKKEIKQEVKKKVESSAFDNLLRIRVDNTFATVSKSKLSTLNELIEDIELSSLNSENSKLYHYFVDGEIKACGEKNYIIVFETQTLKDCYNKELTSIRALLEDHCDVNYDSIAITEEEWEQYREEFKSKKRKYEVRDDLVELSRFLESIPKEKNTIELNFSDLIQVK